MKNQRQATVDTIINIYEETTDKTFELNGPVNMKDVFDATMKAEARDAICEQFTDGMIQYRPEFQAKVDNQSELRKYVGGLINNWLN